jgi:hypothetical protein
MVYQLILSLGSVSSLLCYIQVSSRFDVLTIAMLIVRGAASMTYSYNVFMARDMLVGMTGSMVSVYCCDAL